MDKNDFSNKVKDLGLNFYNKAKSGIKTVKKTTEQKLLADKLRKRFNLENPYKFLIITKGVKSIIKNHISHHAKRYNEDDIFVFYGEKEDNDINIGDEVKDLSDETKYEVVQVLDVTMTVKYEDDSYDVPCTAIYGKMIV
jgi:hypothetical protein